MGFLDKLRGGEDIVIKLSVLPLRPAPGTDMVVSFDVGGELDDKCRAVKVGIRCTGHYLVKEHRRDQNNRVTTDTVSREVELHHEEHQYPAELGTKQATFTIPANALPWSKGVVMWQVYVTMDRHRAMDKTESGDFFVRLPAEVMPAHRTPTTFDDGLTLDDLPVAVPYGTEISGRLTVQTAKDVDVTATRIRLYRRRTYVAEVLNDQRMFNHGNELDVFIYSGNQSTIVRDDKVVELDLSEKRSFSAGQIEQLPFTLKVPITLGTTTTHPYAVVDWRVEAVLDRRMRDDLAVSVPLAVY